MHYMATNDSQTYWNTKVGERMGNQWRAPTSPIAPGPTAVSVKEVKPRFRVKAGSSK